MIEDDIHVFNSAIATFHSPSDISRITGMCHKHIWATTSWIKGPAQYDTILVSTYPGIEGVCGFEIARVFLFSFQHRGKEYPCALVQWFSFLGLEPHEDRFLVGGARFQCWHWATSHCNDSSQEHLLSRSPYACAPECQFHQSLDYDAYLSW